MVWWWWALPGAVALLGVVIVIWGLGLLFRGKPVSGAGGFLFGAFVLAAAAAGALLGLNIQTYQRLTYERPVATIALEKRGPRLFEATLAQPPSETMPAGSVGVYEIHGDEWRIEARVLKFKPWANVLGLDSQYQLDRLSGRYEDVESELHAERSVYDLRPVEGRRLDLWKLSREHGKKFPVPVVDTLYGSAAFMPMADGARYEVWITQSGLVARPSNAAANEASSSGWR